MTPSNDGSDGNFFLFSMSDNDFITQVMTQCYPLLAWKFANVIPQNGHLNGGEFNYSDASGFNLDSQILSFRVTLPTGDAPGS